MTVPSEGDVHRCLTELKIARATGDKLKIDLAQNAFDDTLDRYLAVTDVTRNTRNERSSRAKAP